MMIILILVSIIAIVLLLITETEELTFIPVFGLGIKVIILGFLIGSIINGRVIDEKIDLIEQKNKEIENKVEIAVKTYMEYEGKTFSNLKSDSYIQLVNLYPELESDELIKSEIALYKSNIEEVNNLRMKKIEISNYKWWVYFGK